MEKKYKEKKCPVCNTTHHRRGETCSKECAMIKRTQYSSNKDLVCILCGKIFHTKDGKGKYCSDIHFKNCEVCGKSFPIPKRKESKRNPTCGLSCGAKLSHMSKDNKKKRKQNSLAKWGVEHPLQATEVKEKIAESVKNTAGRFGTEASKEAMRTIYGVDNASKIESVKKKKSETFNKNYTSKGIYPKNSKISKINLKWRDKLVESTGLDWEMERYFENVGSIDLYTEHNDARIAVEINPTGTHNSYKNVVACIRNRCEIYPCKEHGKTQKYHYERSRLMKEQHNVSLTSIFDWMDETKLLNFINSKLKLDEKKIYARKTKIVDLTQTEANRFLKNYHMLGASRKQIHCYGLTYDDILVQVQTYALLGKEDNVFEAKRLATIPNTAVIGGVSKLTKHFLREVEPKKIVAYSDLNLSYPDYDVEYNGFVRTSVNKPQKCWSKGNRMILQKSAAYQSADRLIGIANDSKTSIYPENWSNEQVFLAEGWLPVWDCGMLRDELEIR